MNSIFLRSTATILLTVFSTGFTLELAAQNNSQVAPPLYEGSLFIDDQGTPAKRGGSLAVLADSNLYLVLYFGGLSQLWGQIDLYDGDPRSGGTINRNLAIGVPGTTAHGGGLNQLITLTPAEIQLLNAGSLYLQLLPSNGNLDEAVVGNMQPAAMTKPEVFESILFRHTHARPFAHGAILAVVEGLDLHLAMFFQNLPSPWQSIDLYKGGQTADGELIQNLGLNFAVAPESSFGLGATITLTDDLLSALYAGQLFVRVTAQDPEADVRGQVLVYPNTAPGQSEMISPINAETFVIGGDAIEDPVNSEEFLFTVEFSNTTDPDGNPVRYFWQISRTETYSLGVSVSVDFGIDSISRDFTVGEIAEIFDSTWEGFERPDFIPVTYYVRAITTDGVGITFGETESVTLVRGKVTDNEPGSELPSSLTLHGNYPNPFNPSTTILFDLPIASKVNLEIMNILGQTVAAYSPGVISAGERIRLDVDGSRLPSGPYFYRITASTGSRSLVGHGQMVILK